MVETKTGRQISTRPTRYSRVLSNYDLRANDVRVFSKAFKLRDEKAVQAILSTGMRGGDIRALQGDGSRGSEISRKAAVREAIGYLTPQEEAHIRELSEQ